jgi:hypothetical protein
MAGSIQKSVILAKVETTSGTDAAPTNLADAVAIRVSNLSCKIAESFADRDVIIGAFAAPDRLPYMRRATVSFSVELAGSGAAGTAPQWGDLLIGCGFAETVTASIRVDYTPSSTALKTLTIWAYINDRLEKYTFCAGTFSINAAVGQIPTLDFTFTGLVSSSAAAASVTPTLTAWVRPLAVGMGNTTGVSIGAVTQAAGVIAGGTVYPLKELSIDCANDVQDLALVGTETVGIYNRAPTAKITGDFTGAQAAAFIADMHTGTPRAFGLTHGTSAGNKVTLYAPAGVITAADDVVDGSVMLNSLDLTLRPSAGNDDFRLVAF